MLTWARAKVTKIGLFLIGPPLGAPGEPKATKMEPKGAKMTPGDPQIEVLGSKMAPRMCATIGTASVSHWMYYVYILHHIYYL